MPLLRKNAVDYLMLAVCPLMLLGGVLVQILVRSDDAVRLYAWHALIVELLICYAPALGFIDRRGGKRRFGLNPISPQEWLFAAALGFASFYLLTAAGALSETLFTSLGAAPATGTVRLEGGWRIAAAALLVGIIPALAEETLFRGVLLFSWMPSGKRRAMWHAAALFALVQIQPAYFPQLLLLGLLYSHIAAETGSVYPSVAMYAGNNLMALMTAYSLSASGVAVSSEPVELMSLLSGVAVYVLMGVLLGAVAYRGLLRAARRRRDAAIEAANKLYKAVRDALDTDYTAPDKENAGALTGGANLCEAASVLAAKPEARPMPFMKWIVALTYVILASLNIMLLVWTFLPGLE